MPMGPSSAPRRASRLAERTRRSHCPLPLVAPGPVPTPVPPGAAAAPGVLPDSVLGPVGGLSPPLFSAGVEPAGVVLPLGSAAGGFEPPHATQATPPNSNAATRFDRNMFRFSLCLRHWRRWASMCRLHAKLLMVALPAPSSSQPSAPLIAEAANTTPSKRRSAPFLTTANCRTSPDASRERGVASWHNVAFRRRFCCQARFRSLPSRLDFRRVEEIRQVERERIRRLGALPQICSWPGGRRVVLCGHAHLPHLRCCTAQRVRASRQDSSRDQHGHQPALFCHVVSICLALSLRRMLQSTDQASAPRRGRRTESRGAFPSGTHTTRITFTSISHATA
jgi:hypothetical protein